MKEGLMDIHKTNYRYFMDNANKYYDQTAMTYAVPIELGETPEGSVDLNREYKYIKVTKKEILSYQAFTDMFQKVSRTNLENPK